MPIRQAIKPNEGIRGNGALLDFISNFLLKERAALFPTYAKFESDSDYDGLRRSKKE